MMLGNEQRHQFVDIMAHKLIHGEPKNSACSSVTLLNDPNVVIVTRYDETSLAIPLYF